MGKSLGITAIVFSAVSLAVSIWIASQADAHADAALRRREQQLVEHYSPKVRQMYEDLGIDPPANPKTVEELIASLSSIATGMAPQ